MHHETCWLTFAFLSYLPSDYYFPIRLTHYRTRGGEWRGCIAATSYSYLLSVVRLGINDWRITVARKLISSKVDSILPDDQSLSVL